MNRLKIVFIGIFGVILFSSWMLFTEKPQQVDFTERVKVAMREAGNQLLLADGDSTSLVLPVKELLLGKYALNFEKELSIHPDTVVTIFKNSLAKSQLPEHYRVEVIQCKDIEVAYSYEMNLADENNTIIPCSGRVLPGACYTIELKFLETNSSSSNRSFVFYMLLLIISLGIAAYILTRRNRTSLIPEEKDVYAHLGSFQFYPEQNKLVKAAVEIPLSKKECELLALFVAQPNQVIKRDELTKRVWEDNGVIVGRSLDTYISKLRKKLQDDSNIKITNIHGVGYKLEM